VQSPLSSIVFPPSPSLLGISLNTPLGCPCPSHRRPLFRRGLHFPVCAMAGFFPFHVPTRFILFSSIWRISLCWVLRSSLSCLPPPLLCLLALNFPFFRRQEAPHPPPHTTPPTPPPPPPPPPPQPHNPQPFPAPPQNPWTWHCFNGQPPHALSPLCSTFFLLSLAGASRPGFCYEEPFHVFGFGTPYSCLFLFCLAMWLIFFRLNFFSWFVRSRLLPFIVSSPARLVSPFCSYFLALALYSADCIFVFP